MGDFNNVMQANERMGRQVTYVKEFKECVHKCDLQEMKSPGSFDTWNNKQDGEAKVMSKIDMVLINNDWTTTLPDSEVRFQSEGLYDHCPALVRWELTSQGQQKNI